MSRKTILALIILIIVLVVGYLFLSSSRLEDSVSDNPSLENEDATNVVDEKLSNGDSVTEGIGGGTEGASESDPKGSTAPWKVYKNDTYGFELSYPSDGVYKPIGDAYGWPSAAVLFLGPAQSYTLAVEMWTDKNDFFEVHGNVDASVVVFKEYNDKYISLWNINDDEVVDSIISTFQDGTNTDYFHALGVNFSTPDGWQVESVSEREVILKEESSEDEIKMSRVIKENEITDTDAKFGSITYYYSDDGVWMVESRVSEKTGEQIPSQAAEAEFYSEGGLPAFLGVGRWLTYIIPLREDLAIKLNISGSGQTQPLTDLAKSIRM